MIYKLKLKFVTLSMTALLVLLVIIVSGMNVINYTTVVSDSDAVLKLLDRHGGNFSKPDKNKGDWLPPHMSPELPYESRYFTVLLDKESNVISSDTSRIASVDSAAAKVFASKAKANRGFVGPFRYLKTDTSNGSRIMFLDCGRRLDAFYDFFLASVVMAFVGFVAVFAIIFFLSGKIIRPIATSYDKQKRFITDAGHEIKTPLTIINANLDLLEMEAGENESIDDIRQQTARLTSLTNELVYLTKMEESPLLMIDFPLSDLVLETVHSFNAPAQTMGKTIECDISPMLSLCGNASSVTRLISVLMDNALKYSKEGSTVHVRLVKQNKYIILTVSNATRDKITPNQLMCVFDRFYRADLSRNSETGGYGIGLSVAKAIADAHGAKIHAYTNNGNDFNITVSFLI